MAIQRHGDPTRSGRRTFRECVHFCDNADVMGRLNGDAVLWLSIIGAVAWLFLNLYAGKDVGLSLLLAAMLVGAGVAIAYGIGEIEE
jgi:hypothetical protein